MYYIQDNKKQTIVCSSYYILLFPPPPPPPPPPPIITVQNLLDLTPSIVYFFREPPQHLHTSDLPSTTFGNKLRSMSMGRDRSLFLATREYGIYGSQSSEGRPHSTASAIALAMVPDVSLHYRDSGANIWTSVGLFSIIHIESLALSSQVSRCCTKKKQKKSLDMLIFLKFYFANKSKTSKGSFT